MKDRVPLYPGRVKMVPVAGQENVYNMTRADQPTQEGTPLNKATLLKDATAALFGLGPDSVPDDVLANLGAFRYGVGNEYVWAKSKIEDVASYTETDYANRNTRNLPAKLFYGDDFEVKYNSEASSYRFYIKNSQSFSFTTSNFGANKSKLLGKYVVTLGIDNSNTMYYFPSDAILSLNDVYVRANKCTEYANPMIQEKTVVYGYVNSPEPDAYPPSAPDEYTYTPLGQLGSKVQIATGSYVGTGKYGSSNPNSLTLPFQPSVVCIGAGVGSEGAGGLIWFYGQTFGKTYQTDYPMILDWQGNTLYWYNDNVNYQLNRSGKTYPYMILK